jgi:hypothetical protein
MPESFFLHQLFPVFLAAATYALSFGAVSFFLNKNKTKKS